MENQQSLKLYRDYQLEVSKEIYPSTIHFMTLDDRENPQPFGSGVLIEIDDHYFVFTAAHVLEGKQGKLFVGIGKNDLLSLGGDYIINVDSDRENDPIDIGIVVLDNETAGKLKIGYTFILKESLGINHQPIQNPQYVALGYPASKSKYNAYKNTIKSSPFIYITMTAKAEFYKTMNCDISQRILVHYEKKGVMDYSTGKKQTGPDTFGMSGCGFWHVPIKGLLPQTKEKKLVAILTDWPPENKNFWIGTRIDIFTEVLRQKFNLDLEKSEIIKVNV